MAAASDPGVAASTAAEIAERIRVVRENFIDFVLWWYAGEGGWYEFVGGRKKPRGNNRSIFISNLKRGMLTASGATTHRFKKNVHINI
jgi:hypothetical protein